MNSAGRILLTIALLFGGTTARADELTIGSKAPALTGLEWVKGGPVEISKTPGKQVTIVEFWATWCGPCIETVPHLSSLQDRFASKGVRVVGVTEEDPGNTLDLVKKFVKKQGDNLKYAIAFDAKGDVYDAYMTAAGQDGIPTAFVVDQKGIISWIGHPMDGLDSVLPEIIAGRYDLKRARKLFDIDRRFGDALMIGDFKTALAANDEALLLEPENIDRLYRKFSVLADYMGETEKAKPVAVKAFELARGNPAKTAELAQLTASPDDAYGLNQHAAAALESALKADPTNGEVRLAFFYLLAFLDRDDHAKILAAESIRMLEGDARMLSRFADAFAAPPMGGRFADQALSAIDLAIKAEPAEIRHLMSKFTIINRCKKDEKAARAVAEQVIAKAADDAQLLNDFAWGLLTDEATKGTYNDLALKAAETMRKAPGGDGWSQLDTLALAKFENGQVDEAVKIQQLALGKAPEGPARYEVQKALQRYLSAQEKQTAQNK